MQKEDLDFFKKWFLDYVARFTSPEVFIQENIKLKIEHTARVCENILLLAKAEKVGEEGCRLAEAIALFHDLGRFEQFMKYRTFKDSESENHALLGVKILENTGILSRLPPIEKDLILKAVECHNLMEIPGCAENSREFLFYVKLIRDADKLDILKNRMAKLADTRNRNDIKLLRMSWVFDLNSPVTHALLKERGYLDTILSSMPETEEIQIIRKHLESFLNAVETEARI